MPNFDEIDNQNGTTENQTTERRERGRDEVKRTSTELKNVRTAITTAFTRRFQVGGNNADLEELFNGLTETYEKYPEISGAFNIIKVSTPSLRYPAVAIVNQFRDTEGKDSIGIFFYPLQDRSTSLEPKVRNEREERRAVPPVPTDVIDTKFESLVESIVRRTLDIKEDTIVYFAGQQIIGKLFVLPYKDNTAGYQELLMAAFGQLDVTRMEAQGDFGGTIQASQIREDHVVVGRIDYTPSIAFDLSGNPIRSDINLTLVEQRKRGNRNDDDNNGSYNNEEGLGSKLIEIDAAINFIFDGEDNYDHEERYGRFRPQRFIPEIRITRVDVRLNPTFANFMYGIASIAAVTQNERWVNAFAPAVLRKNPNRNIGALYIEQPEPGEKAEAQDLRDEKIEGIYKFANYAVSKDTIVTFMVPESSEYSRIGDMIYTMASNARTSDIYLDNYDKLMNELEVMLGKPFRWEEEDMIFVPDQLHRSLIGYYPNGSEYFSTENIDYVSLASKENSKDAIETAQSWDESYGLDDYDAGTKKRANIIFEETDGMVEWTGAQNTVSINMKFLNALKAQMDSVGLGIEIDNLINNEGRLARRTAQQFRAYSGRAEGYDNYRSRSGRRDSYDDRDSRRGRGGRRGR